MTNFAQHGMAATAIARPPRRNIQRRNSNDLKLTNLLIAFAHDGRSDRVCGGVITTKRKLAPKIAEQNKATVSIHLKTGGRVPFQKNNCLRTATSLFRREERFSAREIPESKCLRNSYIGQNVEGR
jgi:hypothetical protein